MLMTIVSKLIIVVSNTFIFAFSFHFLSQLPYLVLTKHFIEESRGLKLLPCVYVIDFLCYKSPVDSGCTSLITPRIYTYSLGNAKREFHLLFARADSDTFCTFNPQVFCRACIKVGSVLTRKAEVVAGNLQKNNVFS